MKAYMLGSSAAIALASAVPALAQQDSGGPAAPAAQTDVSQTQLQDIVVTAQRRSENLQKAAISVTAVSNAQLVQKGVTDISQLTQLAPALRAIPNQGSYTSFALRGINSFSANAFADPVVVVNVDGVPLAHPTGAHGLFYDVERVEILKGPQGTLYGRNATGGAVNVNPAPPAFTFGGFANLEVGNFAEVMGTAALNIPLSEQVAIRAAGQVVHRNGYFSDGTGDDKAQSGRLSLRWKPISGLTMDVIGDYSHQGGKGPGGAIISRRDTPGGPLGDTHFIGDPWEGNTTPDPRYAALYSVAGFAPRRQGLSTIDNDYYGVTGIINYAAPFGDLALITAYRGTDIFYFGNTTAFYLGENANSDQYSGELRYTSPAIGPLKLLVGMFYLHDAINSRNPIETAATTLNNQTITGKSAAYAGFGNLTLTATDRLRFTGGLRYTSERKTTDSQSRLISGVNFSTFNFIPFPDANDGTLRFRALGDRVFKKVTWKAGVEFDVASRSLLYANIGTGFKAGGFFIGPEGSNSYEPETVTAYTIGSKNRFLDNRLQINVEAFLYKYRNQQIAHQRFYPAPTGILFVTDNAGSATIYGAELEAQLLVTRNTKLSLQAQYLHSRYDQLTYLSPTSISNNSTCPSPAVTGGFQADCSGRPLPFTPKFVVSGGISQTMPLNGGANLVLAVDTRYEGARWTQINYLPENYAQAYTRTDAQVTLNFKGDHWSVTAFVQNLENDAVIAGTLTGRNYNTAVGGIVDAILQPPRTYGARLGLKF
ncbi:iron complex outermembrane receptor protein [Sphingomonas vulcanisoli]|uniref:Iron complex outermembrane receptor protein n=1 Tax=Sphingomonas vulcanisoli TaxID=1658060 RepID=A0ABX0TUW1_9SPHN|nr:TonB-dependent receptor [Sphingomonas vulcanisoli]NIJ08489.1 iron complex outermembrane receptor protein [Sphingomonas vulcanisoli]